jgi:hypothetical protein
MSEATVLRESQNLLLEKILVGHVNFLGNH